jgi:hypothetical protein
MRSKLFAAAIAALLVLPTLAAAGPTDIDEAQRCDPIDPTLCLLPFPNDHFTVDDPSTVTGKRIDIHPLSTPRALQGAKPIFTDELNRNDGFSPGSMLLTFVPGLHLQMTWDEPGDNIEDLSWYARPDAPIVIINTTTGERHPFWSELDTHPATAPDERLLIVRPAVNFDEATRYVVALRDLKDAAVETIPAGPAFANYLAGTGEDSARQAEINGILADLDAAEPGFDTSDLYLAWDFTVASWQNLAGRALHIRDDAFATDLGDEDLADLTIAGDAPDFRIDRVQAPDKASTMRIVHGTIQVPNYLNHHVQSPDLQSSELNQATGGEFPNEFLGNAHTPYARFFYPPGSELPARNPVQPFLEAKFTCRLPATASTLDRAHPILMGHGLLGQRYEVNWSSGDLLTRDYNAMYCGTEWIGMSFGDIPQALAILADPSLFPSLADRSQQGYLNFMYLGRLMIHPDGFVANAAFQDDDDGLLVDTTELVYDGNSQGAIMGGALAALAPDFTQATLGVAGMNYSTLLNRSVDYEGEYSEVLNASVPDKREQQIVFALMQMLWDRAEVNGFAAHATDDPYPNTPEHQILLHVALGDFQVANVSAEVEARTMGAALFTRSIPASRHWSDDPGFGFDLLVGEGGSTDASALVYWDSGNLIPPNGNIPPTGPGGDPHGDPRGDVDSGWQRIQLFDTGFIVDPPAPGAYCTHRFPREASIGPACPSS